MKAAKHSVLLVDDEPQILVALEDLLSDDFVVIKAGSAESALDIVDNQKGVAVVVTDQRMPSMAGDELVCRLRKAHGPESILVTGYADLAAVVRAVNEGQIFAYVTKPWNDEDLKFKVAQAAERYQLSKELAEERQLLHDLMDNTPDGIYFKNASLEFLRVNDAYARLHFMDAERMVGRKLRDLPLVCENTEEVEDEESRLIREGAPMVDRVRSRQISKNVQWISETKAPIFDEQGSAVGLVGISRDITRQRDLEQQLLHAQKMEAVGRLAGGVAHDFNNVLAVIQSYGELLREQFEESSESGEDLTQLLKAAQRAASITKQLLCFSRHQPLRSEPLDVNAILHDLRKMVKRLMDETVELEFDLSAPLPTVQGDVTQIEQIVVNLAINARDAMPDGGTLRVSTSVADQEQGSPGTGTVVVSVTDTGVGMSRDVRSRIFEPFFSTKEVGKGTGLGLATVYGIVEQYGGRIEVDSAPGEGTTFRVYLPAVRRPAAAQHPKQEERVRPTQGNETILIVEDDEGVRHVAARILRKQGYRVLEAARPEEAFQLASQTDDIDLLLTDVVMPRMNGQRLYERIRAVRPDLRVLFMSGYAPGAVSGTFPIGSSQNYLEKPFSPRQLAEEVRAALSMAG